MTQPSDVPSFVKKLHAAYEARTGYKIRFNPHRERQWWEWCTWCDWDWTELELARVISYLRSKISKGDRNEGALKFDNLIGNPPGFEEDLNLALEAAKGTPMRTRSSSSAGPVAGREGELANSKGEEVFSGKAAADNFRALLSKPPPEDGKK